MRTLLIYYFCFFISSSVFSQDLTGEWQGHYTYDQIFSLMPDETSIALNIKRNQDSSYTIYSYTKFKTSSGKDTIEICKVLYKKIGKRIIQLEEQKYRKEETDNNTFQKMLLKLRERKGVKELYGRWEFANGNSPMKGDIIFYKK